jgi:hypothetical protein
MEIHVRRQGDRMTANETMDVNLYKARRQSRD